MLLARMAYDVINDYDRGGPIGGLKKKKKKKKYIYIYICIYIYIYLYIYIYT